MPKQDRLFYFIKVVISNKCSDLFIKWFILLSNVYAVKTQSFATEEKLFTQRECVVQFIPKPSKCDMIAYIQEMQKLL